MANTFNTLEIDPDLMRAGNEDVFNDVKYNDNYLVSLYQLAAKNELKLDLCNALHLDINLTGDMATLDTIVDTYYKQLQQALMYKQLYYYYYRNDTGEGTRNYFRKKDYDKRYFTEKQNFHNYNLTGINRSKTIIIRRG